MERNKSLSTHLKEIVLKDARNIAKHGMLPNVRSITIDIPEELLIQCMLTAHTCNVTLNQLFRAMLTKYMEEHPNGIQCGRSSKSKR